MGGAIAVAVLHYRLYDLDLVVNLAYTVSTAIIGAIYLAVVLALSRLLGREVELVIATFAVAVAFAPVRGRVQHVADLLLFGDRSDPCVAFSRMPSARPVSTSRLREG